MRKLRLRMPFRILLSLVAIVFVVVLYFPVSNIFKLMRLNYSFDSSVEIYKANLQSKILDNPYSELLDKYIEDEDFDFDKLDFYLEIKCQERENFLSNINKMIDLRYSVNEINKIYGSVSDDFLASFILHEYVYDIIKYLDVDIFKEEYFQRYRAYFNGDYEKTVLYVNIGLDKEYYTDVTYTSDYSPTMLVNKYHGVNEEFIVSNLTRISNECSYGENYLSDEAALAFEKMCEAASNDGYAILANSTYRDYETQQKIWDQYLNLYGQSYNDKYVTKPGFSEHHTGLAIDIKSANSNIFKESKEYLWTTENCYKYGFIHRYQESKESITGIKSEAWHFRYVGVDVATYIYENKLSFEEYYALFLDK